MNCKILSGLPKSHRWRHIVIDKRRFTGIIWSKHDVRHKDTILLYKNWSSVHFNSDWYEIAANPVINDKGTTRDILILKHFFGSKLNSKSNLIDVNCGAARHLIKLAVRNIFGIGMEGASLLRKIGQEKARALKLPLKIVSTSKYFRHQYFESADIVTSLFNSMGYTFNINDDIRRLQWMTDLLKPKGYFLLDIRAEEYQKQHFDTPTMIEEKTFLSPNSNKIPATIITLKYWKGSILSAEEKILVKMKKETIVQNTTYGWRTYSLRELELILKTVGLRLMEYKFDYYSSPDNLGERIFLFAQKS